MIQLTRPLAFIDIESTGLDRDKDRIVEIAIHYMLADPSISQHPFEVHQRLNPGIPIPETASQIHGITNEMVKDMPSFKDVAHDILDSINDCDIAGFNSNSFDVPMLYNEFLRAGITWDYTKHKMVDVGNIFKLKEPRTLSAAVKFYTGVDHEGAHGAQSDAAATAAVLAMQLTRYPDLPQTIEELALFSNYGKKMMDVSGKFTEDENGVIILTFGKYRGMPAKDHIDFLMWMLRADFPPDTCRIAEEIIEEYQNF